MQYREEHRDLFGVNYEGIQEPYCLAHCISADFGMAGGIVLEFNRRWDMKNRLRQKYHNQEQNFKTAQGLLFPEEVHYNGVNTTVYNMVTKATLGHLPTYTSLENCLKLVKDHMVTQGYYRLAIPKIGCGIDRLDWKRVSHIIQRVFEDTDIEILVCIR